MKSTTNRLVYIPLGGAGEIGMNAYLYGYGPQGKERFALVDLGIAFPDMDTAPGVDIILPDMSWLAERADRLDAIFITHAHEDHIGAIGHLYNYFPGVPVYARPFSAHHARRKLNEHGHPTDMVRVVGAMEPVSAGAFSVSFLPISHSIPESSALVMDTPAGRVIHTGDFKLDPNPVVGDPFDPDLLHTVAKPGVLALVCDSTNVFERHAGRSESLVGPELHKLVAAQRGMVVATTFASNIARLKVLAQAGVAAGRSVCLLGRAVRRMTEAAEETGVLTDFPDTITPNEARRIKREKLMLLVTGSQGEQRAVSAQLSRGPYLGMSLAEGDTFVFSSRTIPGNEIAVAKIANALTEIGVDILTESDGLYHVSGHANRPDLERFQDIVQPQIVIPMHGEHRHLHTHVQLARRLGRTGVLAPNGTLVDLTDGGAVRTHQQVHTGRIYLDGIAHVDQSDGVIRDRVKMAIGGYVGVVVHVDETRGKVDDVWVNLHGLPQTVARGAALANLVEDELARTFKGADRRMVRDDVALEQTIRRQVRSACQQALGKKPQIGVMVTRFTDD